MMPPLIPLETQSQLIREMIEKTSEIYLEEVARIITVTEKEKAMTTLVELWMYPAKINMYMVLTADGLTKVWTQIRESKNLTDVVFATASKLRGLYTASEWESLIDNQSAGASMITSGGKSVVDSATIERFAKQREAKDLLNDNQWVIPILLMNYVNLTRIPDMLGSKPTPRRGNGNSGITEKTGG